MPLHTTQLEGHTEEFILCPQSLLCSKIELKKRKKKEGILKKVPVEATEKALDTQQPSISPHSILTWYEITHLQNTTFFQQPAQSFFSPDLATTQASCHSVSAVFFSVASLYSGFPLNLLPQFHSPSSSSLMLVSVFVVTAPCPLYILRCLLRP